MADRYCSVEIFSESQSSDLLVHHQQRVVKHYHYQANFPVVAPVWAAAAGYRRQSHRSYHHQAQKVTHHQQNHRLEWSLVEVAIEILVAGLALRTCHEMELVYYGRAVAEVLVVADPYSPARRDHMSAAAQETVLVVAG